MSSGGRRLESCGCGLPQVTSYKLIQCRDGIYRPVVCRGQMEEFKTTCDIILDILCVMII